MKISNSNILVFGGAGYIGSHIVLELCDRGYNVYVFDNLSSGHRKNIDSRAKFIFGDILNYDDLNIAFNRDYLAVFHFAALKSVEHSFKKIDLYAQTNIIGTINILNYMIKSKINYFVFSSSAAVYGKPEYVPIDENHPKKPINFYGFTKLEIERLLFWYSNCKGIFYSSLRYFNAAGYDVKGRIHGLEERPSNLLPIIMEVAIGIREYVEIYGNDYDTIDGTGIRDYIHVNDLAVAHVKSLETMIANKKNIVINLATGKGYSVLEIINKTSEILNKKIKFKFTDRRDGDIDKIISISHLAEKTINWNCKYSNIDQLIESMYSIYKQHYL